VEEQDVIDETALRLTLTEYVRTTLGTYGIAETLQRLTEQCLEVLGCAGAGVSVGDAEGRLHDVTATNAATAVVELEQVQGKEGPCHDVFASGERRAIADLGQCEARWPSYVRIALDQGRRAVLGVPMVADDTIIGVLDVHQSMVWEWGPDEEEAAQLLADMAAGYIANLRLLSTTRRLADQLRRALDSRVVIEQAKGVVATSCDVDMDTAFHLLRRESQSTNRRLHEVARDVVAGDVELGL
jgi:GAF domain-containing protein